MIQDVAELLQMNKTGLYTHKELAAFLKVSTSTIGFYLKISRANSMLLSELADKQQSMEGSRPELRQMILN